MSITEFVGANLRPLGFRNYHLRAWPILVGQLETIPKGPRTQIIGFLGPKFHS